MLITQKPNIPEVFRPPSLFPVDPPQGGATAISHGAHPQTLHEEPGHTQVQEVPGVSTRAASRWRVQSAHLSHAFYVVPSSPTSIDSVGRRGAISGTSGAGSASWLGGGLANRVCPGSQDGASPLAQRWCAGRGMAGGEGSGALLFSTLE